jgi:(S)-2-hydroxyglutarate dehydrogenase
MHSSEVIGEFDVAIIGGGIVGLATAVQMLAAHPDTRLVVLEAEDDVGMHQSGHNSGVLHSGVYYKPGSLKAVLCRTGKVMMEAFCVANGVAMDRCGKVIVATNANELERLDAIVQRAEANGVQCERVNSDGLRKIEPAAAGIAALHVPESGIVDYREVCFAMRRTIETTGGRVITGARVSSIDARADHLQIGFGKSAVRAQWMVNCAGLHSDRVLKLAGGQPSAKIVPFRGEYYELVPSSAGLCRNLIYPVPDPAFPFLGVHFTRMIGGGVECGPNAVLALARQGYRWRDIRPGDLAETLLFGGFRKLAAQHWRMGMGEIWRSANKGAFVTALQKLIPSIRASDLVPGRSGVRAQAVSPDGKLIDDFVIEQTQRAIHVLNAPSPAATASLAIGQHIVEVFDAASAR